MSSSPSGWPRGILACFAKLMKKTVLIISTLNTKREETLYLKERVESLGLRALLMDISMRGDVAPEGDIPPDRVAEAGGSRFEDISKSKDRARITNIVIAGASTIAKQLQTEGSDEVDYKQVSPSDSSRLYVSYPQYRALLEELLLRLSEYNLLLDKKLTRAN